jgi:parallel beta-helix repeat protein
MFDRKSKYPYRLMIQEEQLGAECDLKRGVIIVLFLLGFSLIQMQAQPGNLNTNKQDNFITSAFDDDPIIIENNTEFELLGFLGNGSEFAPYLLENLMIDDGDNCLKIWNTDAYFVMQNCTFRLPHYSLGNAVKFTNVTNGIIRNCTIIVEKFGMEYRTDGIDLYSSSNILVRDCNILGGQSGIELRQSTNCTIMSNILKDQSKYGISTAYSNDTRVYGNTLIGSEDYYSSTGIIIGYLSSNSSVYANNLTNFLRAGIRLHSAGDISVSENLVTDSKGGISIRFSSQSRVTSNILFGNDYGIHVSSTSSNNTLSSNILSNIEDNAKDDGFNNIWNSNWYSDYRGSGIYIISGASNSRDTSPQPTSLHIPNFMNSLMVLFLISLIPLGAATGYHMRYREIIDDKLRKGLSLFFMVFSILIPCGVSGSPLPYLSLPNLRYVVTDALFTLGVSRSPGMDWVVNMLTPNDYLLFVSIPYLIGSVLSVVLLLGYLHEKFRARIFSVGIFIVVSTAMLAAYVVSVLLIPITPLLAGSIAFWSNKMRMKNYES